MPPLDGPTELLPRTAYPAPAPGIT